MFTLALIALALAFLCGITYALSPAAFVAMSPLGLVVLLILYAFWRKATTRLWPGTAGLLALLTAGVLGYWRGAASLPADATQPDLFRATAVLGRVAGEPAVLSADRVHLPLRLTAVRFETNQWRSVQPVRIALRISRRRTGKGDADVPAHFEQLTRSTAYGDTIQTLVHWQAARPPANPNAFDYPAWLREQGIAATANCNAADIEIHLPDRGHWLMEAVYAVKRRFLRALEARLNPTTYALAAGTSIGLRTTLRGVEFRDEEIADSFQRSGLSHVLAVSGQHVAILTVALVALLKRLRLRRKLFPVVVCPLLLFFTLVTGAPPSAVRAAIMCGVCLMAYGLFGLPPATAVVVGMCLALALLLLYDPVLLFSPSLLLSFGAVLGLILLTRPLARWLNGWRGANALLVLLWFSALFWLSADHLPALVQTPWPVLGLLAALPVLKHLGRLANQRLRVIRRLGLGRCPRFLRDLCATQLAVQIGAMIPLSAWFFGRYSVAGVVCNLIGIPLSSLLIPLALATGLLGLLPGQAAWAAWPAAVLTEWTSRAFLELAHFGSTVFPYPAVPKPTLPALGVYFAVVLGVTFQRHLRTLLPNCRVQVLTRRRITLCLAGSALLIALLGMLIPRPPARLTDITLFHVEATPRKPAFPVLCLAHSDRSATLINPGDAYTATRVVLPALTGRQIVTIRSVWCGSSDSRAGLPGAAALADGFAISQCHTPDLETARSSATALVRHGCTLHPQSESGAAGDHAVGDYRLEWIPLSDHEDQSRRGLIRLHWKAHRFLIASDCALSELALQDLAHREVRADVLIVPGRIGPWASSAQSKYRALLTGLIAATDPAVIVICDGEPARFAETINLCRTQSRATVISTQLTGALRFTRDRHTLVIDPFHQRQPPIQIPPPNEISATRNRPSKSLDPTFQPEL